MPLCLGRGIERGRGGLLGNSCTAARLIAPVNSTATVTEPASSNISSTEA
jgi:hypothetical protein